MQVNKINNVEKKAVKKIRRDLRSLPQYVNTKRT